MKIILIEEVAPSEAIGTEEAGKHVWNSPPPVEARYRLHPDSARIGRENFAKLKARFWDAEFIEECDMWGTSTGWRLFADAPEKLRLMGFEVEVITKAQQRAEAERLEAERKAKAEKRKADFDTQMERDRETLSTAEFMAKYWP